MEKLWSGIWKRKVYSFGILHSFDLRNATIMVGETLRFGGPFEKRWEEDIQTLAAAYTLRTEEKRGASLVRGFLVVCVIIMSVSISALLIF